tara:strand:- start:3916 stop:4140 length:225 start_codon:yes stop_codon:yes gene_type:complete
MSEENTVTINDEQYDFEGLAVETQANIARVNELRREISTLKMQTNERELLLQAYTRAIVEGVKPVEEEAEVEAS